MIRNSLFKILAILLIIGFNWSGLLAIGQTIAYYNDTENSSVNSMQAAVLDFSATNQNIGGFIGVELGEDKESISVMTKISGSLDIQYKARAEKISGNDNFCNAIKLEVFHSAISYSGALLSFDTATTTALGTWAFELKLPSTASNFAHGEECNVDLVFGGWRQDTVDFNQSGFTDEERIQLRLTSRMIVLNEFLPNPEGEEYGFDFGNDSSDMPQGEWVELYNNSDYSFDLSGWYIKDSLESDINKIMITASNTAPVGAVIGPKSWLTVYMNKAVFNNTDDTVKLFNDSDILIDSYAYNSHDYCDIEPTPGDKNSDTTGGGTCEQVPSNKSYARIPDGIGYWVDPIPTPGRMNILEDENVFVVSQILPQTNEMIVEEPIIDESAIKEPTLGEAIITGVEEATTTKEKIATTTEIMIPEKTTKEPTIDNVSTEQIASNEITTVTIEEQPVIEEQSVKVEEIVLEPTPTPELEPVPELAPENNSENSE